MDGLDCIWLVNDEGEYEQTLDHKFLYRYFDVIYLAKDTNWYGHKRPKIPAVRPADLAVSNTKKTNVRINQESKKAHSRNQKLKAMS